MSTDIDRARLHKRRDQLLDRLRGLGNLMRGSLYTARIRCGSPACDCAKGLKHEKVHLSVNIGGHTRNVYVGERRAEEVSALIAEYHRAWRIIEELTQVNIDLIRPPRSRRTTKEVQS